ncbi:uncharacterized protein (TIGR02466 family) [Caulobacter ginsengisoli]|uniref:Uncharacterized protein (TIGR02466 family) n=1 Tax=Caulobacter ginsengisoli TaxID=400775 RepID=A0ABU0IVV5_9CAUL|nr:TIGR02466 family protein [Caulobacter ginsengisoli]MDQ0466144.1 uncharacterized protein (TIGR02466 family) [Caulobacter ginsengisoli]
MALRSLFVTRLYEDQLGDEALLEDLLDATALLAGEDTAGQAWCKANRYPGYTSYASLDDLPKRMTAFGRLKRKLDRHAAAFAEALAMDLKGRPLTLDSLWVNVLKPGGFHSGHIHPHSVLSGTLYLEVPPRASALRLEDPRLPLMMAAPNRKTDAPEDSQSFVYVTPEAGTVLMWESWLRHEVPANGARSERVSVSFNYAWR